MWRCIQPAARLTAAGGLAVHISTSPARCNNEASESGFSTSNALCAAAGVAAATACTALWYQCSNSEDYAAQDWVGKWAGYKQAGINPGFHKREVNPRLVAHLETFLGARKVSRSVLIPLAGKVRPLEARSAQVGWQTVDSDFLAQQGHQVLHMEVVPQAVSEYVSEIPERRLVDVGGTEPFKVFDSEEFIASGSSENIPVGYCFKMDDRGLGFYRDSGQGHVQVAQGNFFDLKSNMFGQFDACYDRGAFVALLPKHRAQYANVLSRVIKTGGRIFMVALEHPPMKGKLGPPYSTDYEQINQAFGEWFDIKEVERWDVNETEGWKQRMGTEYFTEVAYLLTRKF